jgi:hypothetical protein
VLANAFKNNGDGFFNRPTILYVPGKFQQWQPIQTWEFYDEYKANINPDRVPHLESRFTEFQELVSTTTVVADA